MAVIVFSNLKGGVAKTTNAVAIAECLAWHGHKTLLIDADHQCTAGEVLLGEQEHNRCERRCITLHDLLRAMIDDEFSSDQFGDYVVPEGSNIMGGLENLSVLPCSTRIDDFQTNVAKAKQGFKTNEEFNAIFRRRRDTLRRWLTQNYKYVIVDCPPNIAVQVRVLFSVADSFIIPCVPDHLSVRGSLGLLDRLRRLGFKRPSLGLLWSMYRGNSTAHKNTIARMKRPMGSLAELPKPFETIIHNATAIASALEDHKNPRSFREKYTPKFADEYETLCKEIIQRSNRLENK